MLFGMLRIKNEARWIAEVLRPLREICDEITVLDDHSTDDTRQICRELGVEVIPSPFEGFDESRDKDFLLGKIHEKIPAGEFGKDSRHWVMVIDGDEVLESPLRIRCAIDPVLSRGIRSYSLRVVYLWDRRDQVRVDGVYGHFYRPSLFRLISSGYRYQRTPWGGNMHCSSVPQELLHGAVQLPNARLLHLGYLDRDDRIRKYDWYTARDPGNHGEDEYRHMVIGDLLPSDHRGKHAGPLELRPL